MKESLDNDNFSERQRLLQARKAVAQGSMTIQQASTFFVVPEQLIQTDSEEREDSQPSKKRRSCRPSRLYFLELKDGQLGENWVLRKKKLLSVVENARARAQALDILTSNPIRPGMKSKVAGLLRIPLSTISTDYKHFIEFDGVVWHTFLKEHPIGYENLVPKPSIELRQLEEEMLTENNSDGTSKENKSFSHLFFLEFKDGEPGGEWELRRTQTLEIIPNARARAHALDILINNPIESGMKSRIAGLLRLPINIVISDYRQFTERKGALWYKFLKEHPIGFDKLVLKHSIELRELVEEKTGKVKSLVEEENSNGTSKKKKFIGHLFFLEFKDGEPGGEWVLRRTQTMKIVENAKARAQALDMIIERPSRNIQYDRYVKVARICGLPVRTVHRDYRFGGKDGKLWYRYLKQHPMGYENLVPKLTIDVGEQGREDFMSEGAEEKPPKEFSSTALKPTAEQIEDTYRLEFVDEGNPGQGWSLISAYQSRVVKNAKQRALALNYLLSQGISERRQRREVADACGITLTSLERDWSNLKYDSLPFFQFLKKHPLGFENLVGTFPGEDGSSVKNREKMMEQSIILEPESDEIVCLKKIKEEIIDLVDMPSTSASARTESQIKIRIDDLKLSLVTSSSEQQLITPLVSDTVAAEIKYEPVARSDEYELMNAEYYVKVKLSLDSIIREGRGPRFPCTCINLTHSEVTNIMDLYHAGHFPWYLFKPEDCKDLAAEKELARIERLNTLKEMKEGLDAYLRKIAPCVPRSFDVNKLWKIEMKRRETPKPSSVLQPDTAPVRTEDTDMVTSRPGRKVKSNAIVRDFITGTRKSYNPRKSKEKAPSSSAEGEMDQEKATIGKEVPINPLENTIVQKKPSMKESGSAEEKELGIYEVLEGKSPRPSAEEPCKKKNKQIDVVPNHYVTSSAILPERNERESKSGPVDGEQSADIKLEVCNTEADIIDNADEAAEFLNVVALGLSNHPVTVSISELKCNLCSISFSYLFQLGDHLWAKHSIGQYQCPLCPAKSELTVLLYGHMVYYHDTLICQMCSSQERYILTDFKKHVLESHSYYYDFFDIFCPSKASIVRDMTDPKLKCCASVCLDRIEDTPIGKIFLNSTAKKPDHQQKRKRSTSERGSVQPQEKKYDEIKRQKHQC